MFTIFVGRLLFAFMFITATPFILNDAVAAQMRVVDETRFIDVLNEDKHQYKILFFFTSWCPHCKRMMSEMLHQEHITQSKLFFISLDRDYKKISAMAADMVNEIDVYYIKDAKCIIKLFQRLNIHYENAIPHIAVLNQQNQIISEGMDIRGISKFIS